jgi:histidine ammonia-lyase
VSQYRIGSEALTVEHVFRIAHGRIAATFGEDASVAERMQGSRDIVAAAVSEGRALYGVTTGFGASCETRVDPEFAESLTRNLHRYHGIGVGVPLADLEVRGIVVARAASLAKGWSGVRPILVERLATMLREDLLPIIPSRGSVGASGDLTPLSYVVACIAGERNARLRGEVMPAVEAWRRIGIAPLELAPKESLAVMNGTSVMAAVTALGCARAGRVGELAAIGTALASYAMLGQPSHFDERIFAAKPHRGTIRAASSIRRALGVPARIPMHGGRIQDRYSIRCAPHVIGVLFDALEIATEWVEIELDGVSDNPLIDAETGDCLHGGNFYGGHVGFAADSLKQVVAGVAELLERQIVLLNGSHTNGGLPSNLVGSKGGVRDASHGFKALEITASALVAEALKTATPACLYSRSTEGHNQDKVSMGSIAALELTRVLDLAETVVVLHLLAAAQAVELRGGAMPAPIAEALAFVRRDVDALEHDRPLDRDVVSLLARIDTIDPFDVRMRA